MTYDAFISYAHDADAGLAPELSSALSRLAKPWYRRRALSVFCDTSALSANPALWASIQESMAESSHLVVLASTDAAQSPWVGREIEHWIATKGSDSILLALTDGELEWDDTTGRFDAARSTALPPVLVDAFPQEPLWVDLRWTGEEADHTLRNPRFLDAIAVLAAPMHGIAKDELVGEDLRQHRRTLRVAWAAAICVALLAVAAIAGALFARDKADEAQRRAHEALTANASAKEAKAQERAAKAATRKARVRRAQANAQADKAKAQADKARRDQADAQRDADAAHDQKFDEGKRT